MNIPVTANNVIPSASKSLKRLGLTIIWLELIAIAWMVYSLFSTPKWANTPILEHGIAFSSLLLALGILFLLLRYHFTLPKNGTDAIQYKKPTLLRALLAIQIIVFLYGAYSTYAWGQLYYINLFALNSPLVICHLIVFLALHLTIIVNTAFLVKLIQVNTLISNTYSKDIVVAKLKKSYRLTPIFCIATLVFLLCRLIPKLPTIADSISYSASSAQLLLLIYFIEIALTVLLVCFLVQLLRRKRVTAISHLHKWLVTALAIDLYISMGVAEGGVRALLEFPAIIAPTILSIIAESLLLIILIRISTYTTLNRSVENY